MMDHDVYSDYRDTYLDEDDLQGLPGIVEKLLEYLHLKVQKEDDYGDFPDNPKNYRLVGRDTSDIANQLAHTVAELGAEKRKVKALLEYVKKAEIK